MIIKRLHLHNFGVYAGDNTFEFNGRKPIVLIGGLNGRGKTTFLEAILLALYGKNSFAYDENKDLTYGQYLRSFVNKADNSLESSVELVFCLSSDSDDIYRIKREWNAAGKRTNEIITAFRNGVEDSFLTENWAMFIENVLPSALSSFFFFDGEKIAELAVEKTSSQIKESIKALLGVTVLDHLENDLRRVISRTIKNTVDDEEALEVEHLRAEKEKANQAVETITKEIDDIENELQGLRKKLDQANEEYISKGGDIVTQKQELMEKRSDARARLGNCEDEIVLSASSELPLVLVKDLLRNIREKSEIEHDHRIVDSAIGKMYAALDGYKATSGSAEAVGEFLDYFKKQAESRNIEAGYSLSDAALVQVQSLLDQTLVNSKINTEGIIKKRDELKTESDKYESYLSVDIDEKALSKTIKKIKAIELEIAEKEALIVKRTEERKTLNGNLMMVSAAFNKKVNSYLKKVELNDDGERIIKYANIATAVIQRYRVVLQSEKVSEVADTMTQCYKQLANKKTLIDHIEMDPETLDLRYMNNEDEEVPRKSLSAGEKQLMVIALLWALAICSKRKLPVIIDTPLSRLDSAHRQALVKVYFPHASDQTIILSTDSEIDQHYYKLMKSNIGDEFTLDYDETSKSTTIKRGYFTEDIA